MGEALLFIYVIIGLAVGATWPIWVYFLYAGGC